MSLSRDTKQLLAFVVVVIAAAVITGQIARREAETNYRNQLAGCHRNNPVREAVVLAIETAAQHASAGRGRYAEAAAKVLAAPHVRPDGSVACEEAVHHP